MTSAVAKHKWTPDQIAYIAEAYRHVEVEDVAELVNAEFGLSLTLNQVRAALTNRRIRSGRTGHFQKGGRDLRCYDGPRKANRTSFKKGEMRGAAKHNYVPIGTLRFSADGYMERKLTDDPNLVPARRWVGEHRLIWEAARGPIPVGYVVVFLDGNPLNLELKNLRCVPRGVLAILNKRGLNETTGEARKAALLACELELRAKQRAEA